MSLKYSFSLPFEALKKTSNDGNYHSVSMDTLVEMDKWRDWGRGERGRLYCVSH